MQFNGNWSNNSGQRDGGYVALSTAVTDPLRGWAFALGGLSLRQIRMYWWT